MPFLNVSFWYYAYEDKNVFSWILVTVYLFYFYFILFVQTPFVRLVNFSGTSLQILSVLNAKLQCSDRFFPMILLFILVKQTNLLFCIRQQICIIKKKTLSFRVLLKCFFSIWFQIYHVTLWLAVVCCLRSQMTLCFFWTLDSPKKLSTRVNMRSSYWAIFNFIVTKWIMGLIALLSYSCIVCECIYEKYIRSSL